MSTDIVAKAKFGGRGQREFKGVVASVLVPLWVELELDPDGSYTVRKLRSHEENRTVQFPLEVVESAIDEKFDPDEFAEAYEEAMGLNLDPDADVTVEDDEAEDGDDIAFI